MEFITEGYEDFELSTQLLIKEAKKRNIEVDILDKLNNVIRLKKGEKVEYVQQATKTSLDSYITFLLMENKVVSKKILSECNITVPPGKDYNQIDKAIADFDYFKDKHVVIKPNKTNFGIGITILNDYSIDEYKGALKFAFNYDNTVLIEEFVDGPEYRFLVIGNEVAGILQRVPANVVGDGIMTIAELVKDKNKSSLRGKGYKTPLEKIVLGEHEVNHLKLDGKDVDYVPVKDEQVFLRKNSNISTGGDSIDFTDEIPSFYKEIAVKSANSVGAKICGVDIIIKDYKSEKLDEYAVVEVNFNPALHIHGFPHKGTNRFPEKKVLNLLGF